VNTFIALLRGINVGGNNKMPMADLRALLSGLGFGHIQTYIQSGNAVFMADEENCETVRLQIETAIADKFGSAVKLIVLTAAEILKAAACNPYASITDDPAKLHLGFMADEPDIIALEALRTKPRGTDQWTVADRIFYLHAPDGIGKSILVPFVERTLKVPVTFRKWRTVITLVNLAANNLHDLASANATFFQNFDRLNQNSRSSTKYP
jgi:uncharacterized protein (DUF1697 family)